MTNNTVLDAQPADEVSVTPTEKNTRGDLRKFLRIALAASELESPTLNNLSRVTGLHKQVLINDIKRLHQLGIVIQKDESSYRLISWGPILQGADSIRSFLQLTPSGEQHG